MLSCELRVTGCRFRVVSSWLRDEAARNSEPETRNSKLFRSVGGHVSKNCRGQLYHRTARRALRSRREQLQHSDGLRLSIPQTRYSQRSSAELWPKSYRDSRDRTPPDRRPHPAGSFLCAGREKIALRPACSRRSQTCADRLDPF